MYTLAGLKRSTRRCSSTPKHQKSKTLLYPPVVVSVLIPLSYNDPHSTLTIVHLAQRYSALHPDIACITIFATKISLAQDCFLSALYGSMQLSGISTLTHISAYGLSLECLNAYVYFHVHTYAYFPFHAHTCVT